MAPKIIKPHVRVSKSKTPISKPTRMVVSSGKPRPKGASSHSGLSNRGVEDVTKPRCKAKMTQGKTCIRPRGHTGYHRGQIG